MLGMCLFHPVFDFRDELIHLCLVGETELCDDDLIWMGKTP
jgi:hypothetical protein